MDNIKNQTKRPYWVKRVYKSSHGSLIGLPKKLSEELKLDNTSWLKLFYDEKNQMILLEPLEKNQDDKLQNL